VSGVALHALSDGANDARRLATQLGLPYRDIAVHRFPDGELRVTTGAVAPTTIIYASLDQPNDKLIALLFAAEALRRNGAKRLVLLAPYLCYMRQDTAFHQGEAISQRAIGQLLARTVDRVITVEAHLHRTPDIRTVFPGIEAENLSAVPAFAQALRASGFDSSTLVVGPDAESQAWVGGLADQLGLASAVAHKIRHGDRSVEIDFASTVSPAGRPVLLVDDIVASGGTLIACAGALKAASAQTIDVIITHALYPPEMAAAFAAAGIRSVRSSFSVPHPTNDIRLDDILATALQREINGTASQET
jgi:ribose-phosphate pyrophosphokinase